jgi:ABC-type multidrug transport system fused ATPase/permease subunit
MNAHNKKAKKKVMIRLAILCVVVAGIFFMGWIIRGNDSRMRAELLKQTQVMARVIESDQIKALSGTEADLESVEYLQLQTKINEFVSAENRIQYLYLMGRTAEGKIFFYIDVIANNSDDDQPCLPREVYDEASDELRHVFDTAQPFVEGPIADEWGVWVSALVPVIDPDSGLVSAVFGVDIKAQDWKWDVLARSALSVFYFFLLISLVVIALAVMNPSTATTRPVLRQLLIPLSLMLIIVFAGVGVIMWFEHATDLREKVDFLSDTISDEIKVDLQNQALGFHQLLHSLAGDERLLEALSGGDRERLLSDWEALYKTLHTKYNLTHFYFFDPQRVCLLRIHKPEKYGDLIERFTARKAERTRAPAAGIELGPLGTFTLRVVHPVFRNGRLLGYIELGKEIEDILTERHRQSGTQVAMTIHKKYLERDTWEIGMRMLGRDADWNRLPDSVVIFSSLGRLPEEFLSVAALRETERGHVDQIEKDIHYLGKLWRVSMSPFKDVAGTAVGDLLIMKDISAERARFMRQLVLSGIAGAILLCSFLSFLFILLYRTDRGIRAQQDELSAINQQLRAANQQLAATEQQLRAGNQQLQATEQQLRAANQALHAREQQLLAGERALKKKMQELENMNSLMSERELRVIDMKKEVNALLREFGRPEKYTQGLD